MLRLPDEVFQGDQVGAAAGNALYADHVRNAYVPLARNPEPVHLSEFINQRFCDYFFEIGEQGNPGRFSIDAFGGPDGLPLLLAADDLTQLTFGIGPQSEGVMFHCHTAAWNALMFGEKEWVFFSPNCFTSELYNRFAMLESRSIPEALETAAADGIDNVLRCRQRAGEVVYVPDGWWHATHSWTDTACLGGQRHKDRLPQDWGESLLRRWPGSGLFLNAVAKERADASLYEKSIHQEPFNLRYVVEYMEFLRGQGEWSGITKTAVAFKERMVQVREQGLLARVELSAILAQLAEVMYHTVDSQGQASTSLHAQGNRLAARATFGEARQTASTASSLIQEALSLDPGNPVARGLAETIEMRSRSADVRNVPKSLL